MQAKNKTVPTKISVTAFLKTFSPQERKDAQVLVALFEKVTKKKCVLWGKIFGFGSYHYVYDSGREGDYLATGFALRKNAITIYSMVGYAEYAHILKKVGPHSVKGSCLQLKNLDAVHMKALSELITASLKDLHKKYGSK